MYWTAEENVPQCPEEMAVVAQASTEMWTRLQRQEGRLTCCCSSYPCHYRLSVLLTLKMFDDSRVETAVEIPLLSGPRRFISASMPSHKERREVESPMPALLYRAFRAFSTRRTRHLLFGWESLFISLAFPLMAASLLSSQGPPIFES